jgi:UDP-2,4-diacetamido-2,4,6-trideoxy-beta-L-altropyranose hydrolase
MSRGFQTSQLSPPVNVFIRADASARIGGGHVMRCLTLADELRDRGAHICFVASQMPEAIAARLRVQGHELQMMERVSKPEADAAQLAPLLRQTTCDWLIVDHYGLDARWERELQGLVGAMLVVDDLADRPHACQVLLDQNFYAGAESRYERWVDVHTRCLLGPQYALLRPQFAAARESVDELQPERLFVSVGASDPHRICECSLEALRILADDAPAADIVAGADALLFSRLAAAAADLPNVKIHGFVDDIAALMARCTIAIGAGGSSTWERCALGLPSLVVVVADNQRRMAVDLAKAQVIELLGEATAVTANTLAGAVARLLGERERRSQMRRASLQLVDGFGARRVANQLVEKMPCSG